jgi:hypothetical protein
MTNEMRKGPLFGKFVETGEPFTIERYKSFSLPYIREALRDEITDANEILNRRELCGRIGETLNVPTSWVLQEYTVGGFHEKNIEERKNAIKYEFDVFLSEGFTVSDALTTICEKYKMTRCNSLTLIGNDYVRERKREMYKDVFAEVDSEIEKGDTIVDACTIVGMRRSLNENTLKNYYSKWKNRRLKE